MPRRPVVPALPVVSALPGLPKPPPLTASKAGAPLPAAGPAAFGVLLFGHFVDDGSRVAVEHLTAATAPCWLPKTLLYDVTGLDTRNFVLPRGTRSAAQRAAAAEQFGRQHRNPGRAAGPRRGRWWGRAGPAPERLGRRLSAPGRMPGMCCPHEYAVASSDVVYRGRIITVRRDVVHMPGGGTSQRDVIVHPGAVGVVALDDDGNVLLVNQYRHPVARRLDEVPAGLLDVDGESFLQAAQRELVEEAGLAAGTWQVLIDSLTSPGMTDEAIRLFLARDVRPVERDMQEHEEAEMTSCWLPLEEAVRRALAGELENAMACVGVLAAAEAARRGFAGLRPADAPWPARANSRVAPAGA